jgi:hypothetical protein
MASGLAIVAPGSGAQDFLIHKKTGLKIWRDSLFLELALARLTKNVEMWKRLAENGCIEIQKYD